MIPLPRDATAQDIEQWCNRGVVMFDNGGTPSPAWYHSVSPGRMVEIRPLDSMEHQLVPFTSISVHWPLCGSVNLPGLHYAVHAARQAQRQYRRTWHVAGLDVTTPRAWDVAKFMGLTPRNMNLQPGLLARGCFYGEYPVLPEAERMLGNTHISVALSPRLIMAGDKDGKRMFYYNGQLAATASENVLYPVGEDTPVRRIAKLLEGLYHVAPNS